jgi:hypothetical protein
MIVVREFEGEMASALEQRVKEKFLVTHAFGNFTGRMF